MLRIKRLWEKSGSNFTFLYLKECLKLVTQYLAGSPSKDYRGVIVARDSDSLPSIIPKNLRLIIVSKDWKMVRCILTVLSVFRVFPTSPKINLSSIVEPFNGSLRTLDGQLLRRCVKDISGSFSKQRIRFVKLETSSPDSIKATFGSSGAIMSLWAKPSKLYYLYKIDRSWKSVLFLSYVAWLMILSLPLVFASWMVGSRLDLGALSIVYDQAGKARVVAMTNWVIQVYLFPIHKAIFEMLMRINSDGTFNQSAPLTNLLAREPNGHKFSCYDLSSATDRLPIDLQVDILNIYEPGLGNSWRELLSIDWRFRKSYYTYAVGQPMGAYSSWAMLALTHHVIVRAAALKCGLQKFSDYCVLGDDIVINNDDVALEYLQIMNQLGVSINLSKSVISLDFAEFAKTYRGRKISFTPLGPGLLLRTIRNRNYIGALLSETFRIGMYASLADVVKVLVNGRKRMKYTLSDNFLGLWSCIGFGGSLYKIRPADENFVKNSIAWCFASKSSESMMVRFQVYNALLQLKTDSVHDTFKKLKRTSSTYIEDIFELVGRNWPIRVFELLTKFLSIGFWIYVHSLLKDWYVFFRDKNDVKRYYDHTASYKTILALAKSETFNVTDIHWKEVKSVKRSSKKVKQIRSLVMEIGNKVDMIDTNTMLVRPCVREWFAGRGQELLQKGETKWYQLPR